MKHDGLETGWRGAILGAVALLALAAGAADAAPQCGDDACNYIIVDINSIVEDPDPLLMWEDYTAGLGQPFNPGGIERGDGPPHADIDPQTGWPWVVWSYGIGSSFEVAFTEWTGMGWLPTELLTANAWNDLDPQIDIGADGTGYVVWWYSEGTVRNIRMSRRNAQTGQFELPYVISSNGRRPSVLAADETLFVAFERPIAGGRQQVVVQRRSPGVAPYERTIATVWRSQPLHVRLQQDDGLIWLFWQHTDQLAGYSEYHDGHWGIPPDGTPPGGGGPGGAFSNLEMGTRH
jgi:hypothetical protein